MLTLNKKFHTEFEEINKKGPNIVRTFSFSIKPIKPIVIIQSMNNRSER